MPALSSHQNSLFVKGLLLGDPGSGKTGGLTSLVKAGYKLRIYDFDNLLGTLVEYVQRDAPENLGNVAFQTFTDKMKGLDMPVVMVGNAMKVMPFVDGTPEAYAKAMKQLNHWRVGDEDLGKPAEWGQDTVVVIDSLTNAAWSAFRYVQAMNPNAREPQSYYFSAQQLLRNLIMLLASQQFRVNVLVMAHIDYTTKEVEVSGGRKETQIVKGFPRSVGSAINDEIGAYFNCVLMVESRGSGRSIKRVIRTNSTGIVDLKNPVSFKLDDELPLETGLATFFSTVTNHKPG